MADGLFFIEACEGEDRVGLSAACVWVMGVDGGLTEVGGDLGQLELWAEM